MVSNELRKDTVRDLSNTAHKKPLAKNKRFIKFIVITLIDRHDHSYISKWDPLIITLKGLLNLPVTDPTKYGRVMI
jgi:hypothetical protein